jgi:hypothetical protein
VGAAEVELRVVTDGKVERVLRSEAEKPNRLIFDLLGTSAATAPRSRPVGQLGIERVRFGVHDKRLRIVVDLAGPFPDADVEAQDGEIVIRIRPRA